MEYMSNSHKIRAKRAQNAQKQQKRAEKIIKGDAKMKKKSEISKFANSIISEDAHNVKTYIWRDIILPTAIDTIVNIIKNGTDMIFYGEVRKSKNNYLGTRMNYNGISSRYESVERNVREDRDYNNITLESRGDAEAVLMQLDDMLDQYNAVTIADYYDCIGITGTPSDDDYGWTNLRTAHVVRTRDGWTIKFPRAKQID